MRSFFIVQYIALDNVIYRKVTNSCGTESLRNLLRYYNDMRCMSCYAFVAKMINPHMYVVPLLRAWLIQHPSKCYSEPKKSYLATTMHHPLYFNYLGKLYEPFQVWTLICREGSLSSFAAYKAVKVNSGQIKVNTNFYGICKRSFKGHHT